MKDAYRGPRSPNGSKRNAMRSPRIERTTIQAAPVRAAPCNLSNPALLEDSITCRTACVKLQFVRSIILQNNISSPRKGFTMRHCLIAVLALLALAFTQAVAQNKSEKPSLDNTKIFIEPMQSDLHPFIAAEIVKKK